MDVRKGMIVSFIISRCTKCYIFGNFNYDLAKSNENTHVSDFTEVMLNHYLCSIIDKPTRIIDKLNNDTASLKIKNSI